MCQSDDGDFVACELARRGDAAVASDDTIVGIGQNRIHEAKLPDRRCDLFNLLFRVRAGIPRIGLEILDLAVDILEPECFRQGWALHPGLHIWHNGSSSCTTPAGQPGRLLRNVRVVMNRGFSVDA